MTLEDLLPLYDQQLRIERHIPGVRREATGQVVRFLRPAPGMNFISYTFFDAVMADAYDALIAEEIAYLQPRQQPFSWDLCRHDGADAFVARLLANGFTLEDPDDPETVMVLPLAEAPQAWRDGNGVHDVRRLDHRAQLADAVTVLEQVWGGDFSWVHKRLGDHMDVPGYLSVYVAYVAQRPAATAWIYFERQSAFARLQAGSTVEAYRGRGLYHALLAARAREALARDYGYLIVGAGNMSRPIVARYGFQYLTTAYTYVWQGE